MRLYLRRQLRKMVKSILLLDQSQQMRTKLLTSYIENKKFILNNKMPNNSKKFPFNSTFERFLDHSHKDEIKGTLVTHSRKAMKASLSYDTIPIMEGKARYSLHKNMSQSLLNLKVYLPLIFKGT